MMGISGLLPFIKDASEAISVRKYKGQTVAVDTYCWLHKGAFSCADKLAKGEPTDRYVTYCMKYVDMLLTFGVKPILVFDGCNLPSKEEVEKSRREHRQANLQKGKQLLREGRLTEAAECFTRCIAITHDMARDVIKAARARDVDCVVAPYEADAQLAFLNKAGIAQAVITEDSDLLAFGCKNVIVKMDKNGNGLEIDQKNLGRCPSLGDMFTEEKFRYMCILSGCDYLPSIYGIGLSKACKLIKMARNPDILKVIRKMGQYLKMDIRVPDEYVEGFVKANNTFLYQLVFDPRSRKVVPLNPYPDNIDPASLSYAGRNIGDEKGLQLALGNLDLFTMEVIDDFNPNAMQTVKPRSHGWDASKVRSPSIWSKGYTPKSPLSSQTLVLNPSEKSSTKGRPPAKELQAKRPRAESAISEEDLLLQYSCPSPKVLRRAKAQAQPTVGTPQPSLHRNRFSTLLQRRNQEDDFGDEGTCSRFFGSSTFTDIPHPVDGALVASQCTHDGQNEGQRVTCEESQVTGAEEDSSDLLSSTPPKRGHSGAVVFNQIRLSPHKPQEVSHKCRFSPLQKFQHSKENLSWASQTQRTPTLLPQQLKQDGEKAADSQLAFSSTYFSQSSWLGVERKQSPMQDLNASEDSSDTDEKRPLANGAKVSGLSRVRNTNMGFAVKICPLAPARVSGLRKRPDAKSSGNKNVMELQPTISSLWKNFSYRKDISKCNTRGALSPVRNSMAVLPPESI
ncbi:exonuclease 1 isoform X1 [Paramormyrops kingsleyae]|uniref:exonuclease 1 isoform X1 n=1 Tax=Paramormyrops kingsleyae TaxID=1676925 RepID=UPI000CD640C8|nr:exonuclease 1 isoform X1 [Paramormyrops kingsleyae]XP_023659550.1 exonuclease 1 isoform X1 [Paramormyrops kingsleyae]